MPIHWPCKPTVGTTSSRWCSRRHQMALSNAGGGFRMTRESVPEFALHATQARAKAVSGSAARR